ncbi:MAG: hypothetical protein ACYCUV_16545 [Phycisphaerae bacterium]
MKREDADDIDWRYDQLLGQLVAVIGKPDEWVVGANGNGKNQ